MSSSRDDEETQYVYDLPRTSINRIVKKGIPEGISLGNEPKTAFSKAAIVFIMYLTATSQEHAGKAKRSTLTADDVIAAIDELDLHRYKDKLVETLNAYRTSQAAKNQAKKKKKQEQEPTGSETATVVSSTNTPPPQ